MKSFSLLVACTQKGGIGLNGALPWNKIRGDMKFFQEITRQTKSSEKQNAVIMGRKTWESLGNKLLRQRVNIILTRNQEYKKNREIDFTVPSPFFFPSLHDALEFVISSDKVDQIFIIGGSSVYQEAMQMPQCRTLYVTQILKDFSYDCRFPRIPECFEMTFTGSVQMENEIPYQFLTYTRKSGEYAYLDAVEKILVQGQQRGDRTGVGTLSVFGLQMKFDLSNNQFPLLTTKRMFWLTILKELMWMIKGNTDAKKLSEQGVTIWDGNSSREFLDKLGFFSRQVGDLGPIYGFQWRHFGAEYKDCQTDYKNQGVDQLQSVIELIKKDPNSRRILLCAWNPLQLTQMNLPPCHVLAQFYVSNGSLSCHLYQRSGDMGLGVPFNIASYSFLTCILAHLCHLKPKEFIHTIGDAHIYLNHIVPLTEQIKREPKPFPLLHIRERMKTIDDIEESDFLLTNYNCHPYIKMDMAC